MARTPTNGNHRGRTNVKNFTLEGRAWTRRKLMRELALGTKTHDQLAKEYGSSREAVSRFRARHETEIAEIVERSTDEFVGIAITEKANRLATYEQMLEEAFDSNDRKSAIRILRNVAEEMGHLPSRMQISGAVDVHTSYTVKGADGAPVNMENLT